MECCTLAEAGTDRDPGRVARAAARGRRRCALRRAGNAGSKDCRSSRRCRRNRCPCGMLLVLDNLAGHKTPALVLWLFAHGIMPLYTPVGGSWLNMAESIQRVLKRRALGGQHPTGFPRRWHCLVRDSGAALERGPDTSFEWGGQRKRPRRETPTRALPSPPRRFRGPNAATSRARKRHQSYGHAQTK